MGRGSIPSKQLLTILSLGCFISCHDLAFPEETSDCIQARVRHFSNHAPCDRVSVDEYVFQEATVYVFYQSSCCCDFGSPVYNPECQFLGSLNGFAGNREINGEDFKDAIFIRTLWTNK